MYYIDFFKNIGQYPSVTAFRAQEKKRQTFKNT